MITTGDLAPDFTAPLANGDIETFTLSDRLEGEAPIVLAFFPGAFSRTCTHEMATFRDRLAAFEAADATVYGISIDTPWALNAFREELGLEFGLISDTNREIVEAYGITTDFADIGVYDLAKRAVYVVDTDRTVTYAWITDDPGEEPDYDAVQEAAAGA